MAVLHVQSDQQPLGQISLPVQAPLVRPLPSPLMPSLRCNPSLFSLCPVLAAVEVQNHDLTPRHNATDPPSCCMDYPHGPRPGDGRAKGKQRLGLSRREGHGSRLGNSYICKNKYPHTCLCRCYAPAELSLALCSKSYISRPVMSSCAPHSSSTRLHCSVKAVFHHCLLYTSDAADE